MCCILFAAAGVNFGAQKAKGWFTLELEYNPRNLILQMSFGALSSNLVNNQPISIFGDFKVNPKDFELEEEDLKQRNSRHLSHHLAIYKLGRHLWQFMTWLDVV